MASVETVDDPNAALPVVSHLLRRHDQVVDLSVPLLSSTVVSSRQLPEQLVHATRGPV